MSDFGTVTVDGVLGYPVDEDKNEVWVYYDDWASAKGYKKMDELRTELHESCCSEEEFDRVIDEAEEEFEDWCDEVGVVGQHV